MVYYHILHYFIYVLLFLALLTYIDRNIEIIGKDENGNGKKASKYYCSSV